MVKLLVTAKPGHLISRLRVRPKMTLTNNFCVSFQDALIKYSDTYKYHHLSHKWPTGSSWLHLIYISMFVFFESSIDFFKIEKRIC